MTDQADPKEKTKSTASERMKRAWQTRRARAKSMNAGPAPSSSANKKKISFQLPSEATQEQIDDIIIKKFLRYLDFAIENNDSGVLTTDKFKILLSQVRRHLEK